MNEKHVRTPQELALDYWADCMDPGSRFNGTQEAVVPALVAWLAGIQDDCFEATADFFEGGGLPNDATDVDECLHVEWVAYYIRTLKNEQPEPDTQPQLTPQQQMVSDKLDRLIEILK